MFPSDKSKTDGRHTLCRYCKHGWDYPPIEKEVLELRAQVEEQRKEIANLHREIKQYKTRYAAARHLWAEMYSLLRTNEKDKEYFERKAGSSLEEFGREVEKLGV